MFWRVRSPLEAEDEAWQIACWAWLLNHLGGVEQLRRRALILPTRAFFETPVNQGEIALSYFRQVANHLGVDPDSFDLVAQEGDINPQIGPMQIVQDVPQSPAGTFSMDASNRFVVTYSPALLSQPAHLIPTLVHELPHALLLGIDEEPPGGWEMEEFATDLAVTYFGFGVFNANTAATFSQYQDVGSGTQGWRFERRGYLSPAERAFALAVFLGLRGEDGTEARDHLDLGPRAYFDKAQRYLQKLPNVLAQVTSASEVFGHHAGT